MAGVGGEGRKLYLNNDKIKINKKYMTIKWNYHPADFNSFLVVKNFQSTQRREDQSRDYPAMF